MNSLPARWFFALALACSCSLSAADPYIVGGVVVDSLSHRPLANTRVLLALTTARSEKFEQITKGGWPLFVRREAGGEIYASDHQSRLHRAVLSTFRSRRTFQCDRRPR